MAAPSNDSHAGGIARGAVVREVGAREGCASRTMLTARSCPIKAREKYPGTTVTIPGAAAMLVEAPSPVACGRVLSRSVRSLSEPQVACEVRGRGSG